MPNYWQLSVSSVGYAVYNGENMDILPSKMIYIILQPQFYGGNHA
jgi:hypothetical protein